MVNITNSKTNVENKSDAVKRLAKELPTSIKSFQDSLIYTKKIIVTAISNILYMRSVFDEASYMLREFEGFIIRLIDPKSKHKGVAVLHSWVEGAFDAMDKKYLKCISLSFYKDKDQPEHVFETYDFNIKYTENGAQVTLDASDSQTILNESKTNVKNMLKTIVCITNSLEELPLNCLINMRLFYYEDVTPIDFEPTGYVNTDFDLFKFENGERIQFDSGDLDTKYIQMKLNVNASNSMVRKADGSYTINETFNEDETLQIENYDSNSKKLKLKKKTKSTDDALMLTDKIKELRVTKPPMIDDSPPISVVSDLERSKSSAEDSIVSPGSAAKSIKCGCNLRDEKNLVLIRCEICKYWQHAICYNLLIDSTVNLNHCCSSCYSEADKQDQEDVYYECIFRRVLIWLKEQSNNVNKTLLIQTFDTQKETAAELIKTLEAQMIICAINKKKEKTYQVDHSVLNAYISKVFIGKPAVKEVPKKLNDKIKLVTSSRDDSVKRSGDNFATSTKKRRQSSASREAILVENHQ